MTSTLPEHPAREDARRLVVRLWTGSAPQQRLDLGTLHADDPTGLVAFDTAFADPAADRAGRDLREVRGITRGQVLVVGLRCGRGLRLRELDAHDVYDHRAERGLEGAHACVVDVSESNVARAIVSRVCLADRAAPLGLDRADLRASRCAWDGSILLHVEASQSKQALRVSTAALRPGTVSRHPEVPMHDLAPYMLRGIDDVEPSTPTLFFRKRPINDVASAAQRAPSD